MRSEEAEDQFEIELRGEEIDLAVRVSSSAGFTWNSGA
jgi:hypothetical protein